MRKISTPLLTIGERISAKPDPIVTTHLLSGKKSVYQCGVVACRNCARPIYFHRLQALAEEFSVRCPRCGQRGHYAKREIVIEDLPERRKKPRRER